MCKRTRSTLSILIVCIVSCLLLQTPAWTAARTVASTDRLPMGDWTYDAMMSLAADGLVPGLSARVFQGDRLFDRIEMAQTIAQVVELAETKEIRAAQSVLIDHLVSEFTPELRHIHQSDALNRWLGRQPYASDSQSMLLGYVQGVSAHDPDGAAYSDTPYRASGFVSLSEEMFAIATLADRQEKFFQQYRDGPTLDKVVVKGAGRDLTWSVGREYVNWGPAYSGSQMLSANSPAFTHIRAGGEIDFGKLIGRVKITQFAGSFVEDGKRLHLLGRRYERPLSNRFSLGINETVLANITPSPLVLVMPFYLYQHLNKEVDPHFSCLYGVDLAYRADNGMSVYGELVIDDITAPEWLGAGFGRPRKIGYTLGFYAPNVTPGEHISTFRAEYISLDRLTHEATRPQYPELAYMHRGEIIGHPIGPNSTALYLRGEQYLSPEFSIIGEYFNQKQKESGEPERGGRNVISLTLAYDIASDKSVAFRLAPYKFTPPDSPKEEGISYDIRATFAF